MKRVLIASIFITCLIKTTSVLACTGNITDNLLCETEEILFETGEANVLQEKAQSLGSAVKIYEYLRNNASYSVYHGSRSSSLNTFLGMQGNDVDLASTLIAMYRSVGIKSRYASGDIRVSRADLANWISVENEALAVAILQDQGVNIVNENDSGYVVFEHVWVEALVNFANYRGGNAEIQTCTVESDQCKWVALDPSFKLRTYNDQYRNLLEDLTFDYDAYYHAESSQQLRDKSPLEIFEEQALEFLRDNHPGVTLEDVIDGGEIIEQVLGLLPSSLPYEVQGTVQRYVSINDHDTNSTENDWNKNIRVNIYPIVGGIECQNIGMGGTFSAADLSTKQLTINWGLLDGVTQFAVRLDGVKKGLSLSGNFNINCNGQSEQIGEGSRFNVVLEVDASPFVDPIEVRYNDLVVGGYYLVATGGETSNWSQVKRAYENLLLANANYPLISDNQGTVYVDENDNEQVDSSDSLLLENQEAQDALTGGLLYTAQALYYTRLKHEAQRYSRLKNIVSPIAAFAGIVSTTYEVELIDETPFAVLPGGLLIDLKGIRLNGSWEADQVETYSNETFKFLGHIASSLEHEIWQELTGYDAVSTMRGIQLALENDASLLDIHNDADGNTFTSALPELGFSTALPPNYTRHINEVFGQRITSWEYTGNESTPILTMMRGDLSNYDADDDESKLVYYPGDNAIYGTLDFYEATEGQLRDASNSEGDLFSTEIDIPNIQGTVIDAEITNNVSGFAISYEATNDPEVWEFTIEETEAHPDGGTFDIDVSYTVDDGLNTLNYNIEGFANYTSLGYEVVSAEVDSPTNMEVTGFNQLDNDTWRFTVRETQYHPNPFNLAVSYRIDNGLDEWTQTISGANSDIELKSAQVLSPSGFTIDAFRRSGSNFEFDFRETQTHSSGNVNIDYSVGFDRKQTYELPVNITNVSQATLTAPSAGFELASHGASGSGWVFVIKETRQNSAGNYDFNIQIQVGTSIFNVNGSLTVVGTETQDFAFSRTLWVESSFNVNNVDLSHPVGSFSSEVTLGADTLTLTCNGNTYTKLPSQLLGDLETCFDDWTNSNDLASLFNLLDPDNGFDHSAYYYRDMPIELTEHDTQTVSSIRDYMYFSSAEVDWNFTIPSELTFGPNYLFNVYIRDAVDASNDNLLQSSYIIENKSARLLAGGGYVPEGVPVNPATDTEGVVGSGSNIDTSGATFNNEVFTDQNLVAIANNDIIRTPSTIDPVSTVTGNMYHDETDFIIPGKGLPYTFTRTYNSNETTTDGEGSSNPNFLPLSQGWTHSYNMKLVSNDYGKYPNYDSTLAPENDNNSTSSITYIDERGGESNYLLDDSNSSAQPTSPRAGFDDLVLNSPSSGLHTITYNNGVKYTFDSQGSNMRNPGTVARLYRIEDAYGNQLNFAYSSGRLSAVTDNLGLSGRSGLVLEYYTSGENNGRLRFVRDWTGREWEYRYTGGQLSSVINPLNDAMAYTYVEGTHWLKDIIHPQDRNGKQKTMTFSYYENGQAYSYVDQNGSEESLIYDLFRRRTRVNDPRNFITEHYYDENGALIKLVEPDKGILLFENNEDGLRYVKYNALGQRTRYSYHTSRALDGVASDTNGQVTREQDSLGYTVDYDYGIHGQVTTTKDKNGNRFIDVYYTSDNPSTGAVTGKLHRSIAESATVNGVTHSNVTLVEYQYYPGGNVKQSTEYIDPAVPSRKRVTDYIYDFASDGSYTLTTTVSGSGKTITTEQNYDRLWRLASSTVYRRVSVDDATLLPLTTTYEYDDMGRLLLTTDPIGNITETVYDSNGQVSQSIMRYRLLAENNSPLHPECVVDAAYPNHHTCIMTTNTYDAADRLLTTTDINGATTRYEYNAMAQVTKVTNELGNSLRYEYDAKGRRTKVTDEKEYSVKTEYDLAGRVLKITDANKNSIRYTYDVLGRQLTVTSPEGRITRYEEYDGNGNLKRLTDPNGVVDTQALNSENASLYNEFDEFNRVVANLNANNELTSYAYDLLGNRTRVTDALNQATTFVYDDLGRLITVVDPIVESGNDKVVSISYDEVGNRLAYTDRLGEVTHYYYDLLNRLVREEYLADNVTADKVYDQYGDLVSTSYAGNTYTYTYDASHRLRSKTDNRTNLSMSWQYDSVGNLIRKTNFEGDLHTFTYDSSNRLVAMAVGDDPLIIHASYHYDPAGRLLSRILSNGAATLYNYNADGDLISIKQVGADGYTVDLREYEHDEVGNITKLTVNGSEVINYDYDDAYRLLSANSNNNAHDFAYTYDEVGNRKTKTASGVLHHYIYSTGNRLEEVRQNSATGSLVYSFDYDDNGSLIAKLNGSGQPLLNISYDQRRLASVMAINGVSNSLVFQYDSNAYRIEKHGSSATKKYYLEGEHLESLYDSSDMLQVNYLRGAVVDEVISGFERSSEGTMENRTFHHNQVNSVTALTDHNGSVVQTLDYGPFGEDLGFSGTSQNAMRYTGREKDAESGLYYYRARYYDPDLGRFISEDQIGLEGGINPYAYVGNNPMSHGDPSGRLVTPETIWDIANVGLGLYSLQDNIRSGSYGWAALDAAGLVYDGIAVAVPFLPAGANAGITALRAGNTAADAVNIGFDVARTADISHDLARSSTAVVNTGLDAAREGTRIHSEVGLALEGGDVLWGGATNAFRGANGTTGPRPDLFWKDKGLWADLTTTGAWGNHVTKYSVNNDFGVGIPLLYERGTGIVNSTRLRSGGGVTTFALENAYDWGSGSSANGGFLIYPNKINSNMARSVYSK